MAYSLHTFSFLFYCSFNPNEFLRGLKIGMWHSFIPNIHLFPFTALPTDAGNSVWGRGSLDPCCASCRGEGGRCGASRVCPAPPHVSPPGRGTGPECRATALWHPSYHQAAGPTPLLAYSEGERMQCSV